MNEQSEAARMNGTCPSACSLLMAKQEPWTDVQKFLDLCEAHGVAVTTGDRHNRTDGAVHYVLRRDGHEHVLDSNYWDCRLPGWQEAVEWVLKANREIDRNLNSN